jgi:predicted  nucleic acid-binding Zn-ribbon protein
MRTKSPVRSRDIDVDVDVDVDGIVASYTALGRKQRHDTRLRRSIRLFLALGAIAGVGLAFVLEVPSAIVQWRSPADDGVRQLRALVSSQLQQLSAARAELDAARERYDTGREALERELSAFAQRHAALEQQQVSLVAQSAELREALAAVDAERDALLASVREPDPAVERELEAITAQRRELEERWEAFATQGRQLSDELAVLEGHRSDLDSERAAMDRQRRELEALIEDASRAAETTSSFAAPTLDDGLDPLFANAVMAPELGEMRGGVQLPNGMNIAIGLTRSASLNGVEQYSSSLRLDDLTAGIGVPALQGFGTTVLQNGSGNFVAPNVLDGLSSGFGTIIQNSLDNQEIRTLTTYDIDVSDVSNAIRNIAAGRAISDMLTLQ